MDLNYILLNTIVYGSVALVLWSFFAYQKYLNFAVWIFFIASWYLVHYISNEWINLYSIIFIFSIFWVILLSNYLIVNRFENLKQREFFWLIFTIWLTMFLLSFLRFLFWAGSISISLINIDNSILITILWLLIAITYYLLNYSYIWKMFKWIYSEPKVVKTLWIKLNSFLNYYISFLVILMISIWYLNLLSTNIRVADDIFFLLKWIWIIVFVWLAKLEYIYLWALLYVITEYILFISIWFPISLKEPFILVIILLVLFFKPNWLFTLKSRNI